MTCKRVLARVHQLALVAIAIGFALSFVMADTAQAGDEDGIFGYSMKMKQKNYSEDGNESGYGAVFSLEAREQPYEPQFSRSDEMLIDHPWLYRYLIWFTLWTR